MCCRYYIEEIEEMQVIVSDMMRSSLVRKWNELFPIKTYGEMSPTDIVPVIARDKKGAVRAFPRMWGFAPSSAEGEKNASRRSAPLFNARVETASVRPAFAEAWASHRCVIPASYFFEWGPPPEDPDALADAVVRLRSDPAACAAMGKRAREIAANSPDRNKT